MRKTLGLLLVRTQFDWKELKVYQSIYIYIKRKTMSVYLCKSDEFCNIIFVYLFRINEYNIDLINNNII